MNTLKGINNLKGINVYNSVHTEDVTTKEKIIENDIIRIKLFQGDIAIERAEF